jgi:two-component system cell cycle response regulator
LEVIGMSEKQDWSDAKIMIVDDNAQNVELLQVYLEELKCETIVASDGMEAIEKVKNEHPDLILLDIMMPRMSGFEVSQKLKSDSETSDIPILMVTALNEMGDIQRAVDAGTDDFLSKPINKLELLTRVKTMLRLSHLKGELDRTLAYLEAMDANEAPVQSP